MPRCSTVKQTLEALGYKLQLKYEQNPITGAVVNGELHPLGHVLETENTEIEVVHIFDYYGRRIYRHSLTYILAMAFRQVFPSDSLLIRHSMGNSLFFTVANSSLNADDVEKIRSKMKEIAEKDYEIEVVSFSCKDAVSYFEENSFEYTSFLIKNYNKPAVRLYRADSYLDISYEPLAPRTGLLTVWDLVPYGNNGMLLRYPDSGNLLEIGAVRDIPKLFNVFEEDKQWGRILGVSCLGQMNRKVTDGTINTYIRHAETLQRRRLYALTDEIKKKNSKAVFISGPSSSGKTTFAKKICEQLNLMGLNPILISLDDYYKPITEIPKNEKDETDYECIQALRVELFRENMEDLFNGKEVRLPKWNIAHQKLTFRAAASKLTDTSVFVIEGIHALNPVFSSCVPENSSYRVYISALTQLTLDGHNRISTTDTRILRRIIRDNRTRGVDATTTLSMWNTVADGERKHIFPFQINADFMFNSSLDYEIGVLSTYAMPLLSEVSPENRTAYTEARRLLAFLQYVHPIPADLVPSDSLLREFIGNGDYE